MRRRSILANTKARRFIPIETDATASVPIQADRSRLVQTGRNRDHRWGRLPFQRGGAQHLEPAEAATGQDERRQER